MLLYESMDKQINTGMIRIALDLLEDMRALAQAHTRWLHGEILTAWRDYVIRHKRVGAGKSSSHTRLTTWTKSPVACGGLKSFSVKHGILIV
jgi:hypothetical protein